MNSYQLKLRPATIRDAAALRNLEEESFSSDRLSLRSIRRLIASASARVIVAESGTEFMGAVILLFRRNASAVRIYSLAVASAHRLRGVAAAMLAAAEDVARASDANKVHLEVRKDNDGAARFYRHHGYLTRGEKPGYYADGMDALRMEKLLAGLAS